MRKAWIGPWAVLSFPPVKKIWVPGFHFILIHLAGFAKEYKTAQAIFLSGHHSIQRTNWESHCRLTWWTRVTYKLIFVYCFYNAVLGYWGQLWHAILRRCDRWHLEAFKWNRCAKNNINIARYVCVLLCALMASRRHRLTLHVEKKIVIMKNQQLIGEAI